MIIFGTDYISIEILDLAHCWEHRCTTGVCWVRYMHCSNYEAQGASGNYKAWGASGDYEARGASDDYKAWRASGGKYEA